MGLTYTTTYTLSTMDAYAITGPESLIHAAFKETTKAIGSTSMLESTGRGPYNSLFFNGAGSYWLSTGRNALGFRNRLTLPADWDEFMCLLACLKKPKLPEYVREAKGRGFEVGKVIGHALIGEEPKIPVYNILDPYGKPQQWATFNCTPIREQEFIEGGLKELAEAGYVKGAKYETVGGFQMEAGSVTYVKIGSPPAAMMAVSEKGFAFVVNNTGAMQTPVSKCTLIPALPTTSQGIPYLRQGQQVFYGPSGNDGVLTVGNLCHLLKQGVTELVTKAGRLTQADLILLTK